MNGNDSSTISDDQWPVQHVMDAKDYELTEYDMEKEVWLKTCEEDYNPQLENIIIEFWVYGVLLNIIGIIGVLGNVLSMIILSRPQMRSSFNLLLMGLALCDTIFIFISILVIGIPAIYPYTGYLFWYYNCVYPFNILIIFPIALIAQTASIYVILIVTVERYVAVCHPLKVIYLCTYRRAKISFIVCVCFALVYNMPRFWEVNTVTYQVSNTTTVLHCARPTLLRLDPTYVNIYMNWSYLIVNYIIPFLTLAILNCLIYRQVKRANLDRKKLSRSETSEIRLTTMLFCAVVVFVILNFPPLVLNISEAFNIEINSTVYQMSNLLMTLNNSLNFLIYISFGKKFRRIFLLIFLKRRPRSFSFIIIQ